MSVYLDLTREFNAGRLRTIICSGQAIVLHRLAIASKDGDWILREDQEALDYVLGVLESHGAAYRFGAPLDLRWLRNGWSSHFEFDLNGLRVRTDFFTRSPRVASDDLARLWREHEGQPVPFTGARVLANLKMTACEKDWPFIGELARLLADPAEQILYSRSPHDLIEFARTHSDLVARLTPERPALRAIDAGLAALRSALEQERFDAMDADDRRLRSYIAASEPLMRAWSTLRPSLASEPLRAAHSAVVECAERWLPMNPDEFRPGISS